MPPKKIVKEEKILLGRPGNNLKSGIASLKLFSPKSNFIQLTHVIRSVLPTWESQHFSKQ